MAGGRSTRRRSKSTSGTTKRSLESTPDNAETKKEKSSGTSAKGKKLKLQEVHEKEQRHADNKVDSNIHEGSQESKYVPPFSRSAKRLTEKQCAGNSESRRKSKLRQAKEKKSQKVEKTEKDQTDVSPGYDVDGKEPLSLQQVQIVEANDGQSEGIRTEVAEETASNLETSSQNSIVMVGVQECMERLLELLASQQDEEDVDSQMDVESEHGDPNKKVVAQDGMKCVANLATEKAERSLEEKGRMSMKTCTNDGGTSGRETLKQVIVVRLESDVSLITSNAVLDKVKPGSVADEGLEGVAERSVNVEENKALTAWNGEENIAVDNNNHRKSSNFIDDQTDSRKISNFNNNNKNNSNNNNNKDSKINKNQNNTVYHGDKDKDNTNINKVENEACHEADVGEAIAGTAPKNGELDRGKRCEVNMIETKKADAISLDQEVPMLPNLQDEDEMREENSMSMLTEQLDELDDVVEGQCLVSGKETKESSDMRADMASCQLQPTENNVLSHWSRNETAYLKQDSSVIGETQNTGPKNHLSSIDLKQDVIQEKECVQNGQKQTSMLGVVHNEKCTAPGMFHSAAWKTLDVKEMKLNCGAHQEQCVAAVDQQILPVNSSPENQCGSTVQPEKMEHEKKPSDVAQQTDKTETIDVDMKEEKGNVECLLDVDCELDCTDSQLVYFDESSMEATVELQTFAESAEGPGSKETSTTTIVSRMTEDCETTAMCDMIKGLTKELSGLNKYLMGAWKEVESIKKQRQARLKANKAKRAKQ